jgi:hypothetical protein
MNNHRISITQDSGTRVSERWGRRTHFSKGFRTSCTCGWTEKSKFDYEAEERGKRHQQRPDKSI